MASTSTGRQPKRGYSSLASGEPGPSKWSKASSSKAFRPSKASKAGVKEELKRHKALEKVIEKAIKEASMREFHSSPVIPSSAPAPLVDQGAPITPVTQAPPPTWFPDGDPASSCPGQAETSARLFGPLQSSPGLPIQVAPTVQGDQSIQPVQADQVIAQDPAAPQLSLEAPLSRAGCPPCRVLGFNPPPPLT